MAFLAEGRLWAWAGGTGSGQQLAGVGWMVDGEVGVVAGPGLRSRGRKSRMYSFTLS